MIYFAAEIINTRTLVLPFSQAIFLSQMERLLPSRGFTAKNREATNK
jgi:hypothetical protein